MITLIDAIEIYCHEHNTVLPPTHHLGILGAEISKKVKSEMPDERISQVSVSQKINVNAYARESLHLINKVLDEYFLDSKKFWETRAVRRQNEPKKITYHVEESKSDIFESACKDLNIHCFRNLIYKGKTQYTLTYVKTDDLIKLGMIYQSGLPTEKVARKRIPSKASK